MANDAISLNLLRLRLHLDRSQAEVAKAAGITTLAYRNIETGKSIPRVNTLQALADVLNVPLQDLVKQTPNLRRVRFRSQKRLNTRAQVLTQVSDWLANFTELEELLEQPVSNVLDGIKIKQQKDRRHTAIKAAAIAREAFGLNDEEPVRNVCGLLESSGIKVYPLEVASDAFFGLSIAKEDGGPAIAVNTWQRISVERWIFTAIHELGHLILHLGSFNVEQTQEEDEQEVEANIFGSHFLMPEKSFNREWDETYGLPLTDRVMKVKRIFRVSYKTVLYRVAEKVGKQIWNQFYGEYTRDFRRVLLKADEPSALGCEAWNYSPEDSRAGEPENLSPADFQEGRLWCLVRKAYEKELITLNHGAEILGLKLEDMRRYQRSWV